MTKEQSLLLELIKQSQFGSSNLINFDGIDMDSLYVEALQHAVLGLVAPEIPLELRNEKWNQAIFKQKASYIRYCNEQGDLIYVLNEAFVPFVILKGNASAFYYKDPSRRMMGDIDFLVIPDKYEQAKKVLSNSGFEIDHDNGRHVAYRKNNQIYELHHHFSHNIDIESFIKDGLNKRVTVSIDGFAFPMLPKLANGLVLLDHIRNHIKAAIGLRQIIDWMMYVFSIQDNDYWINHFLPVAKSKGLYTLAITLTRMCQVYLGLPDCYSWCNESDDELCRKILEMILNSGNFGVKNGQGAIIESVSTRVRMSGILPWLQNTGESNWKAYHKHKWLKPFCWLYQLFRYFHRVLISKRKISLLKRDLKQSKHRYEILKELDVFDE